MRFYHNPRCSKSRAALALLEERGARPEIVRYLETPPTEDELREIADKAGLPVADLLRTKEAEYRELGLGEPGTTNEQRLAALAAHPRLLERPILVSGDRAVIGRPPERVLELL